MAIKGQLLEIRNEGHYQFFLRVGIYDDILPIQPSLITDEEMEEDGLPIDKEIHVYECRLDFSDADKPVSYPLGELIEAMEVYETNELPDNLPSEKERLWKIAFIIDTIIAEAFSTDVLEVVYGDDFEPLDAEDPETWNDGKQEKPGIPLQHSTSANVPISCPDCGARVKAMVHSDKKKASTYACEICGRLFSV